MRVLLLAGESLRFAQAVAHAFRLTASERKLLTPSRGREYRSTGLGIVQHTGTPGERQQVGPRNLPPDCGQNRYDSRGNTREAAGCALGRREASERCRSQGFPDCQRGRRGQKELGVLMVPRKPARFATFVLIGCLAVMAAACSGTSPRSNAQSGGTTASLVKAGGTLRLGTPNDPGNDPQQDYNIFEVFWCCTSRTLLSLNLLPANQGGTALYPDLASSMPTVSSDGLTWTFHIKPNIHYSPPFQNTVVTSKDFVTALEREANPQGSVGGYSFYYSVIQGFDAYSKGSASSITGLSIPNATTLVIH